METLLIFGIALTALWIALDPGMGAVFRNFAISINFIRIPGSILGYFIQSYPAIIGMGLGLSKIF